MPSAILYGAQNPKVRAVIAQSPFASMQDVIWTNTRRALPTPPILLAPFVELWVQQKLGTSLASISPLEHIHAISPQPVFIMMGGQDIMTDPPGGQRLINSLFRNCRGRRGKLLRNFPLRPRQNPETR